MSAMSDSCVVALAGKIISSKSTLYKTSRKKLEVGSHDVNATVRIDGVLEVLEDQRIPSTSSLLNVEFLLMVLHKSGVTRDHALGVIETVAQLYLKDYDGSKEAKAANKKFRQEILQQFDPDDKIKDKFKAMKDRLPMTNRAGAVKFEGCCNVVEAADEEVAA